MKKVVIKNVIQCLIFDKEIIFQNNTQFVGSSIYQMKNSQLSDDSGNFNDSFVSQPINLHIPLRPPNNQGSSISQQNFGEYQPYKLSELVRGEGEETKENQVMMVVGMEDDCTLIEGHEFGALLRKYSAYDLAFVTVTGGREVGKSFFCDKILNLAEIKGNHFTKAATMPGLYISKTPFFQENLCIILMEIGCCQFGTPQYSTLSFIALLLSSSILLIGDYKNQTGNILTAFEDEVQKSLVNVDLEEGMYKRYMPQLLFNLLRKDPKALTLAQNNLYSSHFFANIHNYGLPSAMTENFAGQPSDLLSSPFLNKACISPSYIKSIHYAFKKLLENIEPKILPTYSLVINGNIAYKLIRELVLNINDNKKVRINELQTEIVKQLYISAYNYCVVGYQRELEEYFCDEKPKDIDEILEVFERATDSALQRFDQFNLCKSYAEQYERKLQSHITEKQKILLAINEQKTEQQLYEYLLPLLQKPNIRVKSTLTQTRPDLSHNRSKAISFVIKEMIVKNGKAKNDDEANEKMNRMIEKYQEQVVEKQKHLQKVINAKKVEEENEKKKYNEIKNEQKDVEHKVQNIKQQISTLRKRMESVRKGEGTKELKEEKEKLQMKKSNIYYLFNKLKSEDEEVVLKQLKSSKKEKLSSLKQRQSQLQSEIEAVKNPQLPMTNNNQANVKPSQSSKVK